MNLRPLLKQLGIAPSTKWTEHESDLLRDLGSPDVLDDVVLQDGIAGFVGVGPDQVAVTMTDEPPVLPDYVIRRKRDIGRAVTGRDDVFIDTSSGDEVANNRKVFLKKFVPGLVDTGERLGLEIGVSDYWTYCAVEKSVKDLHSDLSSANLQLEEFPRKLNCHIIVVTADQRLVLCRRAQRKGGSEHRELRYQWGRWSASIEESIDGEKDKNGAGVIDPANTVKRALGKKEELGLPDEVVKAAIIKFVAIGTEPHLTVPLITVVRLPETDAERLRLYYMGAADREHSRIDTVPFSVESAVELIRKGRHSPFYDPKTDDALHGTARLRILSALFSEFGAREVTDSVLPPVLTASSDIAKGTGERNGRLDKVPTQHQMAELLDNFREIKNVSNAQERGYAFEKFLDKFFHAHGLCPRGSFRIVGEQIDGSFEWEGDTYLVEARWRKDEANGTDLLVLRGKCEKSDWTRGLFISINGFSDLTSDTHRIGRKANLIAMSGHDLILILETHWTLPEALRKKLRHTGETGEVYLPLADASN